MEAIRLTTLPTRLGLEQRTIKLGQPVREHVHEAVLRVLMLVSKFFDEGTFQNRSWAEVSHLPAYERSIRETN